jgi:ectoine hydroxylase-related dioxygenase (phytanoyl-CoA dioxygenase family)
MRGLAGPMSEQQVRAFFESGFTVVSGVFTAAEVETMRGAFDRLKDDATRLDGPAMVRGTQFVVERVHENGSSRVRIDRIVWCGAAEPVLSAFGRDRRLVRLAAQLLGVDAMSQLINQAHFKLPGDGVAFPWHQDSTHRRYGRDEWKDLNGRGSYVQTIIALDDVTEDNGPLEFLPGSCLRGHLDLPPEGDLPDDLDASSAVAATMRAGSVLLFGPYTIHRSLPNRSDQPRRIFINGFAFPGANSRVYPGDGAGRMVRLERGPDDGQCAGRALDDGP